MPYPLQNLIILSKACEIAPGNTSELSIAHTVFVNTVYILYIAYTVYTLLRSKKASYAYNMVR